MTIGAIVKGRTVTTVPVTMPMGEVVALLARHRIGAVPVLDGARVVGVFSERDVVRCLAGHGATALDDPVGERMSSPAVTVSPDRSVLAALALMTDRRIRHLPVVEDGALLSFVSIGDLVKHRIDGIEAEAEAAAMRDYIAGA